MASGAVRDGAHERDRCDVAVDPAPVRRRPDVEVGRMTPLREVRFIVLHTVGVAGDTTMAAIRRFHVHERGWADAGYHFGIRKDGTVETGRDASRAGAHVAGLNTVSLGVCVYGNGDTERWTDAQREAVLRLVRSLMDAHDVPAERVIGHREVNRLIDAGKVAERWRTTKTCPGRLIDMASLRVQLAPEPEPEPESGWIRRLLTAMARLVASLARGAT